MLGLNTHYAALPKNTMIVILLYLHSKYDFICHIDRSMIHFVVQYYAMYI